MIDNNPLKYSDEWFLGLYLKYGSVEEVYRSTDDFLPISPANFHRLVNKYGLIKSAGRHVSLPETLHFFHQKALKPGAPLERIYKSMPRSFKTSLSTLHRIYHYMEKAAVRRYAAALLISTPRDSAEVLFGQEVFGNSRYGKKTGNLSIPMSFAKNDESDYDSVLRVLQQEVFSTLAQSGNLAKNSDTTNLILNQSPEPFSYFDILDVQVKVFRLTIPSVLVNRFSSYKLINHRFENINALNTENFRLGVREIINIYNDYLYSPEAFEKTHFVSEINRSSFSIAEVSSLR